MKTLILLVSLVFWGCVLSPEKDETMGYAIGMISYNDSESVFAVGDIQGAKPESTQFINGDHRVWLSFDTASFYKIKIRSAQIRPYITFSAYRAIGRAASPNGRGYWVLKDSAVVLKYGNACVTWDQSHFSERVPCLPYVRE